MEHRQIVAGHQRILLSRCGPSFVYEHGRGMQVISDVVLDVATQVARQALAATTPVRIVEFLCAHSRTLLKLDKCEIHLP